MLTPIPLDHPNTKTHQKLDHQHPKKLPNNSTLDPKTIILKDQDLSLDTPRNHRISTKPVIQLNAALPPQTFDPQPQQPVELEPAEFTSLLSVRKLSFGTLTGTCAGVFIKNGLNFLTFLFGGGFVLLQINWKMWAKQYEYKFWSAKEPPTKSIVTRFLDFLTSDIQYQSTFTVGFFLRLRIGGISYTLDFKIQSMHGIDYSLRNGNSIESTIKLIVDFLQII
ncbi:hypothetical protein PGT21_037282 [Puccinia graminis f. sp. tritici]|uniref:Uncharacterized protein n=1 Tax=Puccinia graminis f. sp. tritici TaxID=56615 RepID=A0A5B0R4K8_PUCGR|nr:hypothetical protein PGT21_037282 [Puccinia graminis f. sp. tritici]